ncbi:glutathione S-transferase family protein [Svornostia abyssi]|uniref:Glutathione S-transferase family protein n=1 Tax=Svornostia abyssi TaxID=2898438 RepID=A0ABY5PK66_9ACTN|nr:glutathione S-transferase family protein [Parviterribacteraceae bacterium J379]
MLRVHSIPFSANVDRVALAAGLKGLQIEWIEHPYEERSAVVAVSGQSLVPVVEYEGAVICDSPVILRWLDDLAPEPRLWPDDDDVLRARVDVFVEWFNGVWKGPPNALEALWQAGKKESDEARALAAQFAAWTPWFEGLLAHGGPYLFGERLTAADVVAWPFLRYASWPEGSLPYVFEHVLQEVCGVREQPRLMAWIERLEELPRA